MEKEKVFRYFKQKKTYSGGSHTSTACTSQANCANNADLLFLTFWLDFLTNKPAFSDWLLLAVYQACLARLFTFTIHVYLA